MWKHLVANLSFLISLRFINCCPCNNTNTTDLNLEKRHLELEEYTTLEYVDNATETSISSVLNGIKGTISIELIEASTTESNQKTTDVNEITTELKETIAEFESSTTYTSETTTEGRKGHIESYRTKYQETHHREEGNSELDENSSDLSESIMEATENIIEVNESANTVNESTTEVAVGKVLKAVKHKYKDLERKCPHFKVVNGFDLKKMADVWQVVYYQLPHNLKCFKLHIKLVKHKEQHRYAGIFGNFNNTVHWDKCFLEIMTGDKTSRKHFLQGTQNDMGVMENIIIDQEHRDSVSYLTLYRESGDQWLVIKNLLVMRDCDTGDLVVFTRVPLQPKMDEILYALRKFGEPKPNGTMACQTEQHSWIKYVERVNLNSSD